MKKIIVLLMALVLFFVPFGSAFAYTGGWLQGKIMKYGVDQNTQNGQTSFVTDGNEETTSFLASTGTIQDTLWYEFANPVSITHYQLKASSSLKIGYVTSDGTIGVIANSAGYTGIKTSVGNTVIDIKKVFIENTTANNITLNEIDVFGTVATPSIDFSGGLLDLQRFNVGSSEIDTLVTTPNYTDNDTTSAFYLFKDGLERDTAWYEFPEPVSIKEYRLLSDKKVSIVATTDSGSIVASVASPVFDGTLTPLVINNVKKIALVNRSTIDDVTLSEFNIYAQPIVHDELSNLTLSSTHDSVGLMWNIPSDNPDFTGTKIYKNGTFLTSVNNTTDVFTDNEVNAYTTYTYKVTAVYADGHETAGLTTTTITQEAPPPPDRDGDNIPDDEDEYPDDPTNTPPSVEVGEVKNLEITTTYKSANLSWVLPKSENLQHVNIYRDTLTEETSFMDKLINVKKAYAASEKIFETNGTYFNDYTVEPGTEYEYTVTTTSVDGVESEGVTATTQTPGKPAITFEELSLPFSVKDLITSGNGLLWIVGPFLLLALAFLIVPKLRSLIIGAFRKDSKVSSEASERRTKAQAIQKMEIQEAKESRTAREPKIERVEVAPKPIREPKELKQPRIREPKERTRTPELSRERIREPRAPRTSRETREPRERTRKPRDRRGIS